jgi:predicted transposase YdaD
MSKPFDATMRKLIEMEPAAWLRFLHVPIVDADRVKVIDSNLSTVTADADKVLWVDEPAPWIEHVELQAARDIELPDRVHGYSTLLRRSRKVPVHTTIVLLRSVADGPELSGTYEQQDRHGDVYDWFRYDDGIAVFERESGRDGQGVSAMILGIRGIEESSVYQDIFAKGHVEGRAQGLAEGFIEGRTDEARQAVLQLGRKKLGQPDDGMRIRIAAIADVDRLNSLLERILEVASWDELLTSAVSPN